MTPQDYLELIQMTGDSIALHAMNSITLLSAYLTVAYLAGKNLSKFQVALTTILYSVFYVFPVLSTLVNVTNLFRLMANFRNELPDQAIIHLGEVGSLRVEYFSNTMTLVFAVAWIGSIMFMADIRRRD